MIDKIRNTIASIFEDAETEIVRTVRIKPIILWATTCGVIGGIVPFLILSRHSLMVSLIVSFVVLSKTFRQVFNRYLK